MGTDYSMKYLCDYSGIPFDEVLSALYGPEGVTIDAEVLDMCTKNRNYLYERGLWGVPCLECDGRLVFGQDKLYVIERILSRLCNGGLPADSIDKVIEECYPKLSSMKAD